MPFRLEAPRVLVPLMPKPPVPVVVERESAASSSSVAIPSVTRPETADVPGCRVFIRLSVILRWRRSALECG